MTSVAQPLFVMRRTVVRGLVAMLALLLSGVPHGVVLLVTGENEHCSTPCSSADDDGDCSPVCMTGQCAKIPVATPVPMVLARLEVIGGEIIPSGELAHAPVARLGGAAVGVVDGIFHPPRA
jgi:hypothetical protein